MNAQPHITYRPFTEFRAFTASHRPAAHRPIARPSGTHTCGCRSASLHERAGCTAQDAPCPHSGDGRQGRGGCADPFEARFGRPLPLGIREAAAGMSWPQFTAAFRPADGPLRMLEWNQLRSNPARKTISATLQVDGETRTARASGSGTISAMTAIVYGAGCPVEINEFHQQRAGRQTATFLECSRGYRRYWAMGLGSSPTESIVDAFVSAANILGTVEPAHQRRTA